MSLNISDNASKCSDLDILKHWYQSDNIYRRYLHRIQGGDGN